MAKSASRNFHVDDRQSQFTLAAALRQWLPGKSWTEVQRLIRTRHVTINGNLCLDVGRRLKVKEVVKLLDHPAAPPPREQDVRIRHLDAHLVIVEKPPGVTSNRHDEERDWKPRRKQIQPTLDELVSRAVDKLVKSDKKGKGNIGRAGKKGVAPPVRPVHRLDRETSGLMVFGRTVAAELHLGQQFKKHTIERRYVAIAHGDVPEQTIETHLVRDRGDGRRGSTKQPDVGKRAVTHVRPLERLDGYTLIECRLETGRTHQIRIHLAELGHPLCGEKVYNHPLFEAPRIDKSGAPRIALHAQVLGLVHPASGETLRFEMPLPRELADFLNRLRRNSKP